jgi:hypothetical protein
MFANTLTLTVDSVPYTLTRVKEQNGQSEYSHRGAGFAYTLKIRNSQSVSSGRVYNVYNMLLTHSVADTVSAVGFTNTSSFTGRFVDLQDPTVSSDLQSALHALGSALLPALAAGEV